MNIKFNKKTIIIGFVVLILLAGIFGTESDNGTSHEGEAKTPSGSSVMAGRNYEEVIKNFEDNGFTNIRTEKIEDLITGWMTKDGEVEDVSVAGDVNYSPDKWVPNNTEVIIRYHTFSVLDDNLENEEEIEKQSDYDYAFIKMGNEYDIYYLINSKEKIVKNFTTSDNSILVGTYTGDLKTKMVISYDLEGETFQEILKYSSKDSEDYVTLIDNDGFDYAFFKVDVSEAEAIINQDRYTEINPLTEDKKQEIQNNQSAEEEFVVYDVYTVENCDDIYKLIHADLQKDDVLIRTIANLYYGEEIELELLTAFVEQYKDYNTRFNYLLYAIDDEQVMLSGPAFYFEDVGYRELHLEGENKPSSFDIGLRCIVRAKVEGYENGFVKLKPLSIKVIETTK